MDYFTKITNATYNASFIQNSSGLTGNTAYLYYAMVVNQLIENAGFLQFNKWAINGKQAILISSSSGESGRAGYGNPNKSQINKSGAIAGKPFNIIYSKLTNACNGTSTNGGNGGSALLSGRYTELWTGQNLQVGVGRIGATNSSTSTAKIIMEMVGIEMVGEDFKE